EDKNSIISKISITQAKAMDDKIQGGKHVKLKTSIDACESGVKKVHILDGRVKHSLLLEYFTDEGIGTLVGKRMKMNNKEQSHIIPTYK
ncbi:hypothetical protein LZC07_09750, partial [Campylobacter coli]|nr:hypothetical protein [Campylobacter coli]